MIPVERWISPIGDETAIDEHDIDRARNEIRIDLDAFHVLLELAGFTRVDNLHYDQIRDA